MNRAPSEQGYRSTSPFPSIDKIIEKEVQRGEAKGWIRRWVYFPDTASLLYDIDGNRWCENIARSHKSNHIYYVVDLKRSVYFQKCHDPDCRLVDFKSTEVQIPLEANPILNESDVLIEDFESSFEDILNLSEEVELDYLLSKVEEPKNCDAADLRHVDTKDKGDSAFFNNVHTNENEDSADCSTCCFKSPDPNQELGEFSLVEFDECDELWDVT